jgi:hypothetical protein
MNWFIYFFIIITSLKLSANAEPLMEDIDPGNITIKNVVGRKEVSCKTNPRARVAIIMIGGQSNAANESDPNGLITTHQDVRNFNMFDKKCYQAKDPLIGNAQNRSSFATRLGELLVYKKAFDVVILIPFAYGGSTIAQWAPGGIYNQRMMFAVKQTQNAGLKPTHFLWQQGEGDRDKTSEMEYIRYFINLTEQLRMSNMQAPIYLAQSSRCRDSGSVAIRSAQRNLVSQRRGIFAGPNTDLIGPEGRWDGCHFSSNGMDKVALLWFNSLLIKN